MPPSRSHVLTCTMLTPNIPISSRMSATQNIQHQPTTALVDNVLLEKNQRSGPCKTKLPEWSRQERRPDAPSFLNSLITSSSSSSPPHHFKDAAPRVYSIATSQDRHHDRPQWSCCGPCDVLQTSTLSPDSRTCNPVRQYFHLRPNARPSV